MTIDNGPVRRLFEGEADGHYTLPPDFAELAAAAGRLRALPLPADAVTEETLKLRTAVRRAAEPGGTLPSPKALAAAYAARPALAELARARETAAAELDRELQAAVAARADEIIVDHLRPAQEETLAEAAAALQATGGVVDPASASQAVREASAALERLAARYGAVRAARAVLVRMSGGPVQDGRGHYAELRNLRDLWVTVGTWQERVPPWPEDPVGRLRWLVTSGAEPWCPTVAEQDGLFAERHPSPADVAKRASAGATR